METQDKIAFLNGIESEYLTPSQVSKVLGGNPYTYNLTAKQGKMTFPHMWRGNRLYVSKQGIINFIKGGTNDQKDTDR